MQNSIVVANRFLELAKADNNPLTPMQLLKLVYMAHGWMLGVHSRPLISDRVEAWQYGPVIPALYREIRKYKSNPVADRIRTIFDRGDAQLDDDEDDIIGQVYDVYGRMSGPRLSRITHAPGTPWHQTYEPGSFGDVISNDLIEDHYEKLAERAAESAG